MRKITSYLCLMLCFAALILSGCEYLPLSLPTTEPTITPTATASPEPTATSLPKTEVPDGPYPPVVVNHTPKHGQEVPVTTEIIIHFDQPMARESVAQAFRFYPPTDGDLAWRDDTTMVFQPETLMPATRYHVSLSPEAVSAEDLALSTEVAFAFSTVSALEVTQLSPATDAQEVRADEPLFVAFNHVMVPSTCVGQLAKADCPALPLTFSPAVLGEGLWVNTSLYRFDPLPGWAAGVDYQVTLDSDIPSLEGAELAETVNSGFTTALPVIVTMSPVAGNSKVPLQTEIRVTFNTPMDQEITASVFSVRAVNGGIVPGTVTWEEGGAQLLFTPTYPLTIATRYHVRIGERARAVTSAPLQNPQSWAFTTVPYPAVIAFTPTDDAEIDVLAPVSVAFVGDIDATTLDNHVRITPPISPTQLYKYFDPATNIYHLSWDKQAQTEYCVTLAEGIADIYGNAMTEEQTACFTTGDHAPFIGPAADMNIFTLAADAEPIFYFLLRNIARVDYDLQTLDESSFINTPRQGVVGRSVNADFERFTPSNQLTVEPVVLTSRGSPLPTGYYYLSWEPAGWDPQGAYIAVVDHHVTLKLAPEEALVWVTDLQTGIPISRTAVRLVDTEGVLVAAGTTDDVGIARIPISQRAALTEKVAAIVGEPGDVGFGVAVTGWMADAAPWHFNLAADYGALSSSRVFLQTDRARYHPGQFVQFSGIVWAVQDVVYNALPAETTLLVALHSPTDTLIYSDTLTVDEWGHFADAIALPDDAVEGEYTLHVALLDAPTTWLYDAKFTIATRTSSSVELTVLPESADYTVGDTVRIKLAAEYDFGAAVSAAALDWQLLAVPLSADVEGQVVAQGLATTDELGQVWVELPADLGVLTGFEDVAQRWTLVATLPNDLANALGTTVVHPAQLQVALSLSHLAVEAGTRVPVVVQVLDWLSNPVPDQTVDVVLIKRDWYEVPATTALDEPMWAYTDTIASTDPLQTEVNGTAETSLSLSSVGNYIVRAEATDADGRVTRAETLLWVGGEDFVDWPSVTSHLQLHPDAEYYRVGDTAHILLATPFVGPYQVLMTVEREGILQVSRLDFDIPNPLIELPIEEDYAPNVYISFVALQSVTETVPLPLAYTGYTMLRVAPTEQMLALDITSDDASYAPGDTATLTIQVQDSEGAPVDAAVTLAVLADAPVASDFTAIVDQFYGVQPLRVVMGDSLLIFLERIVQQMTQLTTAEHRVMMMMLGMTDYEDTQSYLTNTLRETSDILLWQSDLRTGAGGAVQVTVALPDELTTWRVQAYAITEDAKVGAAQMALRVSQPLQVLPETPRFFVAGDRPQIAAVVYNHSEEDVTVDIAPQVAGVGILGDVQRNISIPAGEHARVAWTLDIPATVGERVGLTFSASGGGYQTVAYATGQGEVAGSIPVYRPLVLDAVKTAGRVDSEQLVDALYVPSKMAAGSTVQLQVDTSLLSVLSAGLEYVTKYPYASTDVLVDHFLPRIIASRASDSFSEASSAIPFSLSDVFFESLARLYAQQNVDGGWGWWQDESDLHLTAYVVIGMAQAQEYGFVVREDVYARALAYLQTTLALSLQSGVHSTEHAFALYALALGDYAWPEGAASALYTARDSLDVMGQAYLLLALGRVDASDTRAVTLLEALREAAQTTVSGVHWEVAPGPYWQTNTLATAVVMTALTEFAPDDVLLPEAISWLLTMRQADHWDTISETAWSVMALAAYLQSTGMASLSFDWSVALNDTLLHESADTMDAWQMSIALDGPNAIPVLRDEVNVLALSREAGTEPLYYTAQLLSAVPASESVAESRGLSVWREYCLMTSEFEPDVCTPLERVMVGDMLEVRLTLVVPQTQQFVSLLDTYPAGFEPAADGVMSTPIVVTTSFTETENGTSPLVWWWGNPFAHWELDETRAAFFARELEPGTYQVRYVLRAAFPGVYQALPATAQRVYFPEVWGRSDGALLEILPFTQQ